MGILKKKKKEKRGKNHGNTNKQHAIKMSEWISSSNPKDWEKKFIFFPHKLLS